MKKKRLSIFVAAALALVSCSQQAKDPVVGFMGFENQKGGEVTLIDNGVVAVSGEHGNIKVYDRKGKSTPNSLLIQGGESKVVEITNKSGEAASYLGFSAERWTSKEPFSFRVEMFKDSGWKEIYNGDQKVKTGWFSSNVLLPLPGNADQRFRIVATTHEMGGVLIDDLTFFSDAQMRVDSVVAVKAAYPVLKRKKHSPIINFQVYAAGVNNPVTLEEVMVAVKGSKSKKSLDQVDVLYSGSSLNLSNAVALGKGEHPAGLLNFVGSQKLVNGVNNFWVTCKVADDADITGDVAAQCLSVTINGKEYSVSGQTKPTKGHLGIALRKHNDDNSDTYRIPGLATTNKGTLIGVYDVRYNNGADLQEDIDVGMSRSTDGGQTWEPMKIIMDMKEWGGLPNDQNGIGDPSVLVDRTNNTIWVAAVWAHGHPGKRNWWASKQGISPKKTSQFVLVKSEDDGKTWSEPINITKQIKDKEWHLLLEGPGKGITMKNGTIVFPAQFKDKDQMPHSTIIWSKDHGKSWHIGTGAKSNTTEAQVIELSDGGLMLNMRDNRNGKDKSDTNGRAIAVTYDMGKTWKTHSTSNGALHEPTCMASLIKEKFMVNGKEKELVLFSNPNSKYGRHQMTIKVSTDDAETWPAKYHTLIDSGYGRGYSCMSKIDDKHVGILYEGSQSDLIFQIFSIDELMK